MLIQRIYSAILRHNGLSYFNDGDNFLDYSDTVKDFVDTVRNDGKVCYRKFKK